MSSQSQSRGGEVPSPEMLRAQFFRHMRMKNCSSKTITAWGYTLERFIGWCADRGIDSVVEVTPEILAAYRRSLFHYRNPKTGLALKFATQSSYLLSVRRWFHWLTEERFIGRNVADRLEVPKAEQRLPAAVLTADEAETILCATDVTRPLGLRDRAILETFYSTALRCSELAGLEVYDLESARRIVKVRQGKGKKDRVVPIGQRAMSWVEKYTADVRPGLVSRTNTATLFVSKNGHRFSQKTLSPLVRRYIERAGIAKAGSCHLFRHTAATLMMENGADLRSLQEMLGHERLTTTQIYTHVSIKRLREVHERTHPAKMSRESRVESPEPGKAADERDGEAGETSDA